MSGDSVSGMPIFNRGTNNGYTIAFRGNANDNGANDWWAAQPMCVLQASQNEGDYSCV